MKYSGALSKVVLLFLRTFWDSCNKDFRFLDLLGPLQHRFQDLTYWDLRETDFMKLVILIFHHWWPADWWPDNRSLLAKGLMPRNIMTSQPRFWMVLVFGQLVMAVQCCAEAPAVAICLM